MNTISALKGIINFFYYGLLLITLIICLLFATGSMPFDTTISGLDNAASNYNIQLARVHISLCLVGIILFIFTIYHLRKVVLRFYLESFFHKDVINSLFYAGISICTYAVIKVMAEKIKLWVNSGSATLFSLNFQGFDSVWFLIILGLFFLFISMVFQRANRIQRENELTI